MSTDKKVIIDKMDFLEDADKAALEAAVNLFAGDMIRKLHKKAEEGYVGWANPEDCTVDELLQRLKDHVEILERMKEENIDMEKVRNTAVDVGNFAMMIWNRFPDS